MQRFRGGLVSKAHRPCVSLNSRLESDEEEEEDGPGLEVGGTRGWLARLVEGLWFRIKGLGFRDRGLRFGVWD